MAIMVVAGLAIILYISGEVGGNQFCDISAATSYHLNPLSLKHVLGSLTHIAGQHHHNSHLPEHRSDAALAAASFRRSHLADSNDFAVNNIKNRIIGTMTEMVIHSPVSCRYRYLHIANIILHNEACPQE